MRVIDLRLPFSIAPATPYLSLTLNESDNGEEGLEFVGWYREENRYEVIRFTFVRLIGGKMLHIGGEGPGSPSIGELQKSDWFNETNKWQKKTFPEYPNNFKNLRHFYFQGHDVRVEILAEDFKWKTLRKLTDF